MVSSRERFELLKMLGSGYFAQTYLARVVDPYLVRYYKTDQVAIKVPRDTAKEQTLDRDIGVLVSIQQDPMVMACRNIVRYMGISTYANRVVLVMEYIADGNLRHLCHRLHHGEQGDRKRQMERMLTVAEGVVCGVAAIHHAHIVHRDIKPANILMDGDVPKLTDFGIARMLDPEEMAHSTVGTPKYMSPEILFGEASFPTDIWSIGVTLYEMFTGQHPFYESGMAEGTLVLRIKDAHPLPPSEISDTPAAVGQIILRAMAKDPADRYASADEMLEALRAVRQGAQPEPPAEGEDQRRNVRQELARIWRLARDGGPPDTVIGQLKELTRRHPDDSLVYQQLGEAYNRYLRYEEATEAFRNATRRDPDNGMLYWYLYVAADKQGSHKEALESLRRAVSLGLGGKLQRVAEAKLHQLQRR